MKNIIHYLLIPVGFVFLPFLWLGLVLSGCKITLVEFYLRKDRKNLLMTF